MIGFPEGHDRLVALEWLVQRLAAEECKRNVDPMDAALTLQGEAEAYGQLIFNSALKGGNPDHAQTALSISSALSELAEGVVAEVKATI